MSNTDWYAALESSQPWKAFNAYARDVAKIFDLSHSRQADAVVVLSSNKSPASANVAPMAAIPVALPNAETLAAIALEAGKLFDNLPPQAKRQGRCCAGLPRKYPRMWMAMPHSNSLMLEFRTIQSIPSNGLRSQE